MIDKFFIIVTKDKQGFTIPHVENGKTPELFLSQQAAVDKLRFIRNCYKNKLDYVPPSEEGFSRFFRKSEQLAVTEDQKRDMKWFIENSKVQGAILKL